MQEIAKVVLETEMDLILAHKRAMRLAELAGLSLSTQTTFATAVSEVARYTIGGNTQNHLVLGTEESGREKFIVASIRDEKETASQSGLDYAKRLVDKYSVGRQGKFTVTVLYIRIANVFVLDTARLDEWRRLFRNEPPISSYDELRRRNEQLQSMADTLQKSESQYRTLTNSLPLVIFSLDMSGRIIYVNEWFQQFTGYSLTQLVNAQWQDVINPGDLHSLQAFISNAQGGKQRATLQVRLRKGKTDEFLWHQVSLSPVTDQKGNTLYWIGYMADIHVQKEYEATLKDNIELKIAQQELTANQQKLQEIIGELNRSNTELQHFAYAASHDLQEPLRKILYYSDSVRERYASLMDDRGRASMELIRGAAERMRSLIQDLLSFSLISNEGIRFSEVPLSEVLSEAMQDLEFPILQTNAVIETQALPVINGDRRMMRQVFENLLSNALKYIDRNERPEITVTYEAVGDQHVIHFTDKGIGFDQQYAPQIFSLFKRLHSREVYEGTGMGLAICRKIIELHNGEITAAGEIGRGARFTIHLPNTTAA